MQNLFLFNSYFSLKILDNLIHFVDKFYNEFNYLYNCFTSIACIIFNFNNTFILILDILIGLSLIFLCVIVIKDKLFFILFSKKVRKALEIGSQIAGNLGTANAAFAYKNSTKGNSNYKSNSNSNNSNSSTSTNSKTKKNKKSNFLYFFTFLSNKNIIN